MALSAISRRSQNGIVPRPRQHREKPQPLFDLDDEDELPRFRPSEADEEDPELAMAIQASLDSGPSLAQANLHSAEPSSGKGMPQPLQSAEESLSRDPRPSARLSLNDDDDLYASPSRLETVLSIAGAGPPRSTSGRYAQQSTQSPLFGTPSLLLPQKVPVHMSSAPIPDKESVSGITTARLSKEPPLSPLSKPSPPSPEFGRISPEHPADVPESDGDDDMGEIVAVSTAPASLGGAISPALSPPPPMSGDSHDGHARKSDPAEAIDLPRASTPTATVPFPEVRAPEDDSDHSVIEWSRSPSPNAERFTNDVAVVEGQAEKEENWDAAQEMDPHQEAGEFARFISQMKGKDLDTVRDEIDEEIRELNRQKKTAIRDSEDISQHMISQIMVCACSAICMSLAF